MVTRIRRATITARRTDAEQVGSEIQALLLSLRAPEDTIDYASDGGTHHHGTDALRRRALDHAGFCWKAPGEMGNCGCPFPFDSLAWARENHEVREERDRLRRRVAELERAAGGR